jgi:Flp pilus assembly protein CpaB
MRRSIYLSVFVVLSAIAGGFYYGQTRQASAVIATHDLTVGTRIADADVTIRSVNPASLGDRILKSVDQAIGQVVAYPILQGQILDARQVAPSKNAALLTSGLQVPPGYRIIGLPISPATAVGGALKAGDLVDVIAIANASKVTTLADAPAGAAPIVIGRNVLVLGLRTDQGTQIETPDRGLTMTSTKPASVLVAIPAAQETTYSAAIADSTFVLTLSTD